MKTFGIVDWNDTFVSFVKKYFWLHLMIIITIIFMFIINMKSIFRVNDKIKKIGLWKADLSRVN